MKNILNYSGGKDSTAMYLWALEQGVEFEPVFADTGNEHELTLEYVETIHEKTGGPKVRIVRADFTKRVERRKEILESRWEEPWKSRALKETYSRNNPFIDSIIATGTIPKPWGKWCTKELKIQPIERQVYHPYLLKGLVIKSWMAIRREESNRRANLKMHDTQIVRIPFDKNKYEIHTYRPLINWVIKDIWDIHKKHDLKPNPLYDMGQTRVGCYPCIFSHKQDLVSIAEHSPEHIERIAEWERIANECKNKPPEGKVGYVRTWMPCRRLGPHEVSLEKHGIEAAVKNAQDDAGYLFEKEKPDDNAECSDVGWCE